MAFIDSISRADIAEFCKQIFTYKDSKYIYIPYFSNTGGAVKAVVIDENNHKSKMVFNAFSCSVNESDAYSIIWLAYLRRVFGLDYEMFLRCEIYEKVSNKMDEHQNDSKYFNDIVCKALDQIEDRLEAIKELSNSIWGENKSKMNEIS